MTNKSKVTIKPIFATACLTLLFTTALAQSGRTNWNPKTVTLSVAMKKIKFKVVTLPNSSKYTLQTCRIGYAPVVTQNASTPRQMIYLEYRKGDVIVEIIQVERDPKMTALGNIEDVFRQGYLGVVRELDWDDFLISRKDSDLVMRSNKLKKSELKLINLE